jgi:DNA-binding SARP family transcriptional activator
MTQDAPRFLSSRAYTLLSFGELELNRRAFKQALDYLDEALSLARQLEDRYLLNDTLHTLALVYLRMGDHYTAQCLLEQAVLHANETTSYEGISHALLQGTILLEQQRYEQAKAALSEVAERTGHNGIKWLHTQALARLAACQLALEQSAAAKTLLRQLIPPGSETTLDYVLQIEVQAYPLLQILLTDLRTQHETSPSPISTQANIRIYALGEPSVSIDGKPVTRWRMARAMELFFLLLQHQQPLRKEQILTALWPEMDDPERVSQTLRSTIYYLRHAIGEKSLVKQAGLYWLDLPAIYNACWYDVTAFEQCQQQAHAALAQDNDEAAALALHQMLELYRGDYLQAFYNDWCIARRDALRQALMDAHQQLAMIAWRKNAYEESLHHWHYLLTLDTCLESAHYGIIRCYMRQGKHDLALRQYHACRQELYDQLHATPGPALQKLYQRLLNE